MKFNLGMKIGAGFAALILISAILGGIAIHNMSEISGLAETMDLEYVPQVDAASQIDQHARDTMYAIRGYAFTENKSFLDQGMQDLDAMEKHIAEAKTLAEKAQHLEKLKTGAAEAAAAVSAYKKLVEETTAALAKMETVRDQLNSAAGAYMKNANDFLNNQNKKAYDEFKNNATAEKLAERLDKNIWLNDLIDLGNAVQLANWKAQATRDIDGVREAMKNFDLMTPKFQSLEAVTRSADNIAQLAAMKKSASDYQAAMKQVIDTWQKLNELATKRNETGDKVTTLTSALIDEGLAANEKISEKAVVSLNSASKILATGLVIALILGVIVAIYITRAITVPVGKTVGMLNEMGQGVITNRLRLDSDDEIGVMARTMDAFADTLEHEVVKAMQMLAQGDLTFDAKAKSDRDAIGNALKKTIDDLNALLGEVMVASQQIASGSNQVSSASQALSQGATEQAASLEEISSSMTELASQTKANAANASQANQLAGKSRGDAENGNRLMIDLVKAMNEINQSGQSISNIIKVIDEIAFQTNLLALNAAVEAARAGKHGKGFAVVAEEVRNLAARSAKAAKETAGLIESSVEKAKNGTEIANNTAKALSEIVAGATKVTDLVGEIAAASNEQAEGIGQINQALGQIDQVTQQNTASAEECAAAAEELSSQAGQMQAMLGRFTVKNMAAAGPMISSRPRQQLAAPAAKSQHGWSQPGGSKPAQKRPSEIISLDDREFGKY